MKAIARKRQRRATVLVRRMSRLAGFMDVKRERSVFMRAWRIRRRVRKALDAVLGSKVAEQYRAVRIGLAFGLGMKSDRAWAEDVMRAALGATIRWEDDGCTIIYKAA